MDDLDSVLKDAKKVAKRYKELTGRPLGITGEMAEFTAVKLLKLDMAEVRQSGYDATRFHKGKKIKIQIKGRCLPKKPNPGARIGSIKLDKEKEWDIVVLVLLDEDLEPTEIYEADRTSITKALLAPGSKARNERGALGISKFKSIGKKVWPVTTRQFD